MLRLPNKLDEGTARTFGAHPSVTQTHGIY